MLRSLATRLRRAATVADDGQDVDRPRVLLAATMSWAAYGTDATAMPTCPYAGVVEATATSYDGNASEARREDCHAYLWRPSPGNHVAYVSFRGTDSKADWGSDLDVLRVEHRLPGGDVVTLHEGFLRQLLSVLESLWSDLAAAVADPEVHEICCTGHSMGGSIATIAATVFADAFRGTAVSCYTFGAPRAGAGRAFVAAYGRVRSSFRMVVNRDPAPLYPAPGVYAQPAPAFWLLDGRVRRTLPDTFRDALAEYLAAYLCGVSDPVRDHSMDGSYLPAIRQYLPQDAAVLSHPAADAGRH